jgi:hypothetical protein
MGLEKNLCRVATAQMTENFLGNSNTYGFIFFKTHIEMRIVYCMTLRVRLSLLPPPTIHNPLTRPLAPDVFAAYDFLIAPRAICSNKPMHEPRRFILKKTGERVPHRQRKKFDGKRSCGCAALSMTKTFDVSSNYHFRRRESSEECPSECIRVTRTINKRP